MTEPPEFSLTLYPDPVLRKVADPIETFDEDLRRTVAGMFERMRKSKGVGLAAPQVGLKRRILVLNPSGEAEDDLVLVNPTITSRSGTITLYEEGCLSFPGIYAEIRRPDACAVVAYGLDGTRIEQSYSGFVSRIIQHEFDHLEGVLLVDRMSPADKVAHKSALEELIANYKRNAARTPTPQR